MVHRDPRRQTPPVRRTPAKPATQKYASGALCAAPPCNWSLAFQSAVRSQFTCCVGGLAFSGCGVSLISFINAIKGNQMGQIRQNTSKSPFSELISYFSSKFQRLQVIRSMPVNHAILLRKRNFHQPAIARPPTQSPVSGLDSAPWDEQTSHCPSRSNTLFSCKSSSIATWLTRPVSLHLPLKPNRKRHKSAPHKPHQTAQPNRLQIS